jgi:FKBP-type peptidyl-prolyl cis-trans isomerase
MFGRRQFLWSTAVAVVAATAAGCSGGDSDDSPTQPTEPLPQGPASLQITDLTLGEGTEATNGRSVFIHYDLWRFNPSGTDSKGLQIDSSYARNQPYGFTIGSTGAIVGMSQGVTGMKVGGKRRLIIPPSLAYGAQGTSGGEVRPNEWIVFDVELLAVA